MVKYYYNVKQGWVHRGCSCTVTYSFWTTPSQKKQLGTFLKFLNQVRIIFPSLCSAAYLLHHPTVAAVAVHSYPGGHGGELHRCSCPTPARVSGKSSSARDSVRGGGSRQVPPPCPFPLLFSFQLKMRIRSGKPGCCHHQHCFQFHCPEWAWLPVLHSYNRTEVAVAFPPSPRKPKAASVVSGRKAGREVGRELLFDSGTSSQKLLLLQVVCPSQWGGGKLGERGTVTLAPTGTAPTFPFTKL